MANIDLPASDEELKHSCHCTQRLFTVENLLDYLEAFDYICPSSDQGSLDPLLGYDVAAAAWENVGPH